MSDLQKKIINNRAFKAFLKFMISQNEDFSIGVNFYNLSLDDVQKIYDFLKTESCINSNECLICNEVFERILNDQLSDSFVEDLLDIYVDYRVPHSENYQDPYKFRWTSYDDSAFEDAKLFFSNILGRNIDFPDNLLYRKLFINEEVDKLDSIEYAYAHLMGLGKAYSSKVIKKGIKINNFDFYNMINKLEKSGNIFSINKLGDMYKRFIDLVNEYDNGTLLRKIRDEYEQYRKENVFFAVSDFVSYYNNKYSEDVSSLIGAKNPMLLTDELVRKFCEKDKRFEFAGFIEFLENTFSGKEYVDKFKKEYSTILDNEIADESKNKSVMAMYSPECKDYGNIKKQTLGYFLLKNIPEKYWESFTKMIKHEKYVDFYQNFRDLDGRDYEYVFEELANDFRMELKKANIRNFKGIFERYCNYREFCNVDYIVLDFFSIMSSQADEREKQVSVPFVMECLKLMDIGINLYEFHVNNDKYFNEPIIYNRYSIKFGDIEVLLNKAIEIDPTLEKDVSIIKQRYYEDREKYNARQEQLKERKKSIFKEYKVNEFNVASADMINKFINSEYETVKWFCIKENVDSSYFSMCLETVKENDSELYEKYHSKILKHKQEKYAAVMGNAKQIVDKIINGVEKPDGTFRPFSYLDYKLSTTNDFDAFMDLVKQMEGLTKEQLITVRKFVQSNTSKASMNDKEFMNGSYTFKLPDGSSYTASIEDKEKVLQFLKSKHLLSTDYKLLRLALRGYILGELDIDEEMKENNSGNKSL